MLYAPADHLWGWSLSAEIPLRKALLLLLLAAAPGCAYRIGSGVMAGALEEMAGQGRSDGVEEMGERMIERALLVELGHQLGNGLTSGATDITPEQQARLEGVIEGILTVAAQRAGKGLRTEVSPELRAMVQRDIVDALAQGLRGELGSSVEHVVDRVVTRAILSLRKGMSDEEMKLATADLLRDSIYYAMRESQGGTTSVGETLEHTLVESVLEPMERSVGGIGNQVAMQVDASARRTENTLKSIIGVLVVFGSILFMLYMIRTRQLRRAQETRHKAEAGLRGVESALELLDDQTRAAVRARVEEFQHVADEIVLATRSDEYARTPPPPKKRSDDYMR